VQNQEEETAMEESLTSLFCLVDDFCKKFIPEWEQHLLSNGLKKHRRATRLTPSEIMTIYIHFHQSHFRNFKHDYLGYVTPYLKHYFPKLVSYARFISLTQSILVPLIFFMQSLKGAETGIYFVDSTILRACHVKRAGQNKLFQTLTKKSKSTMGWFFGFKLHLVINDRGQIIAFKLTRGNIDDRRPVPDLVSGLIGKLIGDKGYIDKKLTEKLMSQRLQLITRLKKNMKRQLITLTDKMLLRKRAIIESVNDQLKNISQIEHTRHRSVWGFIGNLLAGLVAYALKPTKPSLRRYHTPLPLVI
jgi:hypothetical protein